ncbi:hypothetical protein NH340_JMT01371 [Sarcoptes scabiei]|nr:hypothetical protein NH340_JMT01371 [Sarcoptes scabiei]
MNVSKIHHSFTWTERDVTQRQKALRSFELFPHNKYDLMRERIYQLFSECLQRNGYNATDLRQRFLAQGAFGSVFRIEKSNKTYACKIITSFGNRIRSEKKNFNQIYSRFKNEISIMRSVQNHPNIIGLRDYFVEKISTKSIESIRSGAYYENYIDDNFVEKHNGVDGDKEDAEEEMGPFRNYFIVMEYANSQSLDRYLKRYRVLNETIVKKIFTNVCDALTFLHRKRIAHRDIKISNLLLHRSVSDEHRSNDVWNNNEFNFVVKLCDFGLSVKINSEFEDSLKPIGTYMYMAPEILRSYYFYNLKQIDMIAMYCPFKGDIWALGVTVFLSLHGFYPMKTISGGHSRSKKLKSLSEFFHIDEPFKSESEYLRVYSERIRKNLNQPNPRLSESSRNLLRSTLAIDPRYRSDIEKIRALPFFN